MYIICEVDSIIGINLGPSPPCIPVSLKLWHAFERQGSEVSVLKSLPQAAHICHAVKVN